MKKSLDCRNESAGCGDAEKFVGGCIHCQYRVDMAHCHRLNFSGDFDELTGVLNRRAGELKLDEQLEDAKNKNQPVMVCMFDVNDLKKVNDKHGHQAGDMLVKTVTAAVRQQLDVDDLIFHLGEDEFLCAFKGLRKPAALEKMRTAIKVVGTAMPFADVERAEAFCFGLVEVDPKNGPFDCAEIIQLADEKLYAHKMRVHLALVDKDRPGEAGYGLTKGQEDLYHAIAESTDDYAYVCDMRTGIFRYPQSMVDEFDLPSTVVENAAEVLGGKIHPHDRQAFFDSNREILEGKTDCHCIEYRMRNRRGEWAWMRCRGHVERNEKGEAALFAGIIMNLGNKNKFDYLTGLFNKFEFEEELDRLRAIKGKAVLLLFGIDNFKHINDLYDRQFGDEVIRIASHKLQTFLPANAAAYRLDGDEFGVIIRGGTRADASSYFDKIKEAFSHQHVYGGKRFFCTLSAGCAFLPENGSTPVMLSKHLHCALDAAKQRGKNRAEYFTREMLHFKTRSLGLAEELRACVESNFEGYALHYQPIFDSTRQLAGAEALCRFTSGKYGPVGPDEFIPILERTGLIKEVGRWIFSEAVRACGHFLVYKSDFFIGINLSCRQMEDPVLVPFMYAKLKEENVPADRIMLELTESCLAENMEQLSELLGEVRRSGIRVSMDDFGTGYSSLGLLKQAPINVVKVDKTFVSGICTSLFDASFLRLVVELCRAIGMQTCLEGVETEEEFQVVSGMKLDFLQGFLLGKPMPEQAFVDCFLSGN